MTALNPARQSVATQHPVLFAFVLFVVLSGSASVAVRATYVELAPFWSGSARFLLAALVFWAIIFIKKTPLPQGRALVGALLYGILTVGLAFILLAWGLVATPASRFQILMATVPLLTVFLASLHGLETLSLRGVIGSLIAVAGIAATVGGASFAELSLPHVIAILVGAAFIAEGGVVVKKFPRNPPVITNAIAMTVGGLMLGLASLVAGEHWAIPVQTNTWIAFLYVVFFQSLAGFMLYLYILGKWSASETSYAFVLNPLVTIILGSTLAGEKITLNFLIGAALVLVGVYFGALHHSPTKPHIARICKEHAGEVAHRCT